MKISKYRLRQNLSFTDSERGRTVSGSYIDILFESENGKFLLPIFILNTNNPDATDTYYSSLGGLGQPRSRKNVVWHDLIFSKCPNAKKIILFSHEYSCLRETNAKSGELLINAILESDIEELRPEGNIYCMAYSAGIGAIMDFIIEIQKNSIFQKNYGLPKELILIDPVGLSPNSNLVIDFFLTIFKSFLFRRKRGLNTRNAISETIKEAKGTWMIIGDRLVTLREIFKDILLGLKRHLKEEIGYFKLSKLLPIKAPVKILRTGKLSAKAKELSGNLKVRIISATKGLDTLTTSYLNYLISQRKLKSSDFLSETETEEIEKELSRIYFETIFSKLKQKNVRVQIIESTHSMIFYNELSGKVIEALKKPIV